jgi:acyl-CoA dehydrogenase
MSRSTRRRAAGRSAVDLAPDPAVETLARRTAAFVREVVVPVEERLGGVARTEDVRSDLQRAAAAAGVFAPHVSPEFGGHGLDMRGRAVVFEEAGYSLLRTRWSSTSTAG